MRRLAPALVLLVFLAGCGTKSGSTPAPPPVETEAPLPPVPAPVPPDLPPVSTPSATSDYAAAQEALRRGDYLGAADRLRKVVEAEPQNAQAWNWLSFALVRTERPAIPGRPGIHKPAIDAASRAILLKPDLSGGQYNLGLALLADGQFKEALAPLNQAVAEQRTQERLTALGLALIGAGQAEKALSVCREADRPQNEFWLAKDCLEVLGDGFRRINPAEAAMGDWLYEGPKGFVWKGKPGAQGIPQTLNISPPWTCAYAYPGEVWEYALGCRGDGVTYAWSAHSAKSGSTPSGVAVGMPVSRAMELLGSETYRSSRGLHYLAGDLHLVVYISNQETVQQIRFERPLPIFAVDKLLRGETGPPALQTLDGSLAGVNIGMSEAEVEKRLGASVVGAKMPAGFYERSYRDGHVKVLFSEGTRKVLRIAVFGGGHKTSRGIAVGSPAGEVKRLYGVPRENGDEFIYRFGYERQATPLEFIFQIRDGKVVRIMVAQGGK